MNDCLFCKGRPVGNAATWLDGQDRPPLACPRCGDITYPDGRVVTYREQLDALSRAALAPAPDSVASARERR